jgi:hypothetical protein
VVYVHGVPASDYLYRKVVPALAIRGLRGIAGVKGRRAARRHYAASRWWNWSRPISTTNLMCKRGHVSTGTCADVTAADTTSNK